MPVVVKLQFRPAADFAITRSGGYENRGFIIVIPEKCLPEKQQKRIVLEVIYGDEFYQTELL